MHTTNLLHHLDARSLLRQKNELEQRIIHDLASEAQIDLFVRLQLELATRNELEFSEDARD